MLLYYITLTHMCNIQMSKQDENVSYEQFQLFFRCIYDISCWDPLKSCSIFPWWHIILKLGLKFFMPHRNWLWGSDIEGMPGDVTTGMWVLKWCTHHFKNASTVAVSLWFSSFKKDRVLGVFILLFIWVKRLSVCTLYFFTRWCRYMFSFSIWWSIREPCLALPLLCKRHHHGFRLD